MAGKEIEPQIGLQSYSCPRCSALAHQFWYSICADRTDIPSVSSSANILSGQVTFLFDITSVSIKSTATLKMGNISLSQCFSCKHWAIWVGNRLIHPLIKSLIQPHEDMPAAVIGEFVEAASIVDLSPRGAAALLRLALQKLMIEIGEKGANINDDIKSLVGKGLEVEIQQALDVVRVVGNNAVHPGSIDLKDDKATALALLQLLNIIVDRRIAAKKRISELFNSLPSGALEAIKKRDGKL